MTRTEKAVLVVFATVLVGITWAGAAWMSRPKPDEYVSSYIPTSSHGGLRTSTFDGLQWERTITACPKGWHMVCGSCARWCPRWRVLAMLHDPGRSLRERAGDKPECWLDVTGSEAGRAGGVALMADAYSAATFCGEAASWP